MILIPQPKHMSVGSQNYVVGANAKIILGPSCGFDDYEAAKLLKREIEGVSCSKVTINKSGVSKNGTVSIQNTCSCGEDYSLTITSDGAEIKGGTLGIFYGIQTLRQIVRQCGSVWPCVSIKDEPGFECRGYFHDVTRGKVPTLKTLKELADRLSFFKINQLQLYVEHSFAFDGFSEAWMGKDPLSAEDILELDEYCRQRHIDLVPAMATFGHLYEILVTKTWRKYSELEIKDPVEFSWHDRMAHHTLDVSNEASFSLVKSMLDQYIPLFSSGKFNICCDETFDIGKGKTAALAQKVGEGRLYFDFLKKIITYVQGYGKQVVFWGDIILKSPEYIRELPKDVECLYWNYDHVVNEDDVKTIADSGMEFSVCPGVCGWNLMMNRIEYSYINISNVIHAGKKFGARGVLNTDWGDFGHVNLLANSMPGMAIGAALSWNPEDKRNFSQLAQAYSAVEFGAGMSGLVELLNDLSNQQVGTWAFIVCWRERKLVENPFIPDREEEIRKMDAPAALHGYKNAIEIEAKLAALPCVLAKRQDMREFICSAHAVALFNAACLAIKKYDFGFDDVQLALGCGDLAVQLEYWYAQFAALWRARNHESELYRIRTAIQDLCAFLRDHADI